MMIVTAVGYGGNRSNLHWNCHEKLTYETIRKFDCHAQPVAEPDNLRFLNTERVEPAIHNWALNDISQFRLEGVWHTFKNRRSTMSSNDLFVGFLEGTYQTVGEDIKFSSVHIQMLLASAEDGFTPAQAVINRVLQSYNIEWPLKYAGKNFCWFSRGTKAGCLINI